MTPRYLELVPRGPRLLGGVGAAPLGTVPNVGGVLNALLHAPGGALLLLLAALRAPPPCSGSALGLC